MGNRLGVYDRQGWGRFADQIGWRVNGVWLEKYEVLNLSINAPRGHLPAFAGASGNLHRNIFDRAASCGF